MRILFTFVGGTGHFNPLLPTARAATAAGHTVAVGCRADLLPGVRAAGFTAFETSPAAGTPRRAALTRVNLDREDGDLRDGFVRRLAAERAGTVAALCADWRPDVLVCDEVDFGAMIAAERLGLPYASVLVIAAGTFVRPALIGAALQEVRAANGLPPDPDLTMLSRYLVLAPVPRATATRRCRCRRPRT